MMIKLLSFSYFLQIEDLFETPSEYVVVHVHVHVHNYYESKKTILY